MTFDINPLLHCTWSSRLLAFLARLNFIDLYFVHTFYFILHRIQFLGYYIDVFFHTWELFVNYFFFNYKFIIEFWTNL